MHTNCILTSCC